MLPAGLLTSGLVPAVSHALASLATIDALVLPASATVFVQAVEVRTNSVCGLDLSAANLYRWHPAYAAGAPHCWRAHLLLRADLLLFCSNSSGLVSSNLHVLASS